MDNIGNNRFVIFHNNDSWFSRYIKEGLEQIIKKSNSSIEIYYWNKLVFSEPIGFVDNLDLILNTEDKSDPFYQMTGSATFYDRPDIKELLLNYPVGNILTALISPQLPIGRIDLILFGPKPPFRDIAISKMKYANII